MMKTVARLVILILWVSFLVACRSQPPPFEQPPTGTRPPQLTPPASPTQAQAIESADSFEAGGARFAARSILVEIPAVAAADFDNDGHMDLVAAGEPLLTIYRGDGAGGLLSAGHVPGGHEPNDFALADLDQDGDIDIVIANHDTDYLTILLGDGSGAFTPAPDSPLRVTVLPHPHAVRLADLDADGYLDLLVDHRQGEGILVLRGLGGARFDLPGILVDIGGDPYLGMALGDLNGDGRLDLVTPNPGEVGVLLNHSDAGIAFLPLSPVPAESPFGVALGDFNADGALDLLSVSGEASSLVQLFLGDGQGGFTQAEGSPIDFARGGKMVVVGDFNGDGTADAAVACYQSPDVLLLFGGSGSFQTGYLPGGAHPWGLAAADLNADGVDDLVIPDDGARTATIYWSLPP